MSSNILLLPILYRSCRKSLGQTPVICWRGPGTKNAKVRRSSNGHKRIQPGEERLAVKLVSYIFAIVNNSKKGLIDCTGFTFTLVAFLISTFYAAWKHLHVCAGGWKK